MAIDQSSVGNDESMDHFREKCIKIMDRLLTEQEAKVLKLRLGFDDEQTRSLEETAVQLGTTRERVRRIEASAIRKLRRPSGPCAKRIDWDAEARNPDERTPRDE